MVVADLNVYCALCNKPCQGEVLRAQGQYYHHPCFNCKACGNSLASVGFFFHNGEFYCADDYHRMFGQSCHQCGNFIEGEAVSALGVTYHIDCFTCGNCGKPFPPGAKVNYDGEDYLCDACMKAKEEPPPPEKPEVDTYPPYINGGENYNDYIPEPVNDAPVEASPDVIEDVIEDVMEEAPPDVKGSSENSCAGCGNEIKTGQALLALDKQWHLWCFTCHKCGRLLAGEYMGRDGVPYCEEDYQAEFGVSCAGCGGYITGKVLQAGEKHYHPQCSRCAKCGQMFGEGEEMYLQGSEIWHPHCSEEYQKDGEDSVKDFPSPPSSTREEPEYKPPSVSSHSSSHDVQESKPVHYNHEQKDDNPVEKPRPLSKELSFSSDSLSTPAYSAKPFSAHKGLPPTISVKFTPGQRPVVTAEDYPENGIDRPRPAPAVEPYKYRPHSSSPEDVKDGPSPPRYTIQTPKEEEVITPINAKPVSSQRERTSLSGSESGGSSAPPAPPPPTRSTSHNWRSRFGGPQSPKSPQSSPSPRYEENGPSKFDMHVTVNSRRENGTGPLPRALNRNDEPIKRSQSVGEYSYKKQTFTDPGKTQTKISISTRSSVKTTTETSNEKEEPSSIPAVLLRRGPTKDPDRESKFQNRKSMPLFRDEIITPKTDIVQESEPSGFNDRHAPHRRSLPSLDKLADEQARMSLTIYPYEKIKTTNYKMPKDIDRTRLEAHLSDEEFRSIFRMSKEEFYKMPAWRQADQKKKAHLF